MLKRILTFPNPENFQDWKTWAKALQGLLNNEFAVRVHDFLEVDETDDNTVKNKMVSNAQIKKYEDHINAEAPHSGHVKTTGDETIAGVKTFSSIPILPASDPTSNNEAVRKAYVDKFIYHDTQMINDDTAYSFTPPEPIGILIVFSRYAFCNNKSGIFNFKTSSTNGCFLIAGGSQVEATTGVLTGTTGTDGNLTVSANDDDGKIYIENRHGGSITFGIIILRIQD